MTNLKKWTAVAMVMIALFTSCKTNDAPQDYVNFYTRDYTVKQSDWMIGQDDESGIYYYYEFSEPNLTQYIYNNGVMQAFLYTNYGNISPLPFNDYWVETDNAGNIINTYTEQVTCEFVQGTITFIVKASDHAAVLPHYPNYDFTVRFMW